MARRAQTYRWRKSVGPGWLLRNEARLTELTAASFATIERPGRKRVLLEAECRNRVAADRMVRTFGGKWEQLPDDWLKQLQRVRRGKPIRVGARLVVFDGGGASAHRRRLESFREFHILEIPAGAAFGTGAHVTTAMSLRLLERVTRPFAPGWRMLDAGTGSGILALAGRRFGAQSILAIDNDPLAISTARQNARVNRIRGVCFVLGDVKRSISGRFEIVTANVYSELLAEILPKFAKCLAANGRLILSGVLRQQEPGLVRSLRSSGFRVGEIRRRGKWIALVAIHHS